MTAPAVSRCRTGALLALAAVPWLVAAQTAPAPAAPAASAPAAAPQRIEVTGGRQTDTEERRQSTAAKIVIGREELERFGDATVSEVLKRLPGVTTGGAPGRGGGPRMRGLGGGYTQILIDGQRVPPGFSLDSLTPEQVERIEVLRAPTAETGARAIGGTINIITREGFRRRINDLRLGVGGERGLLGPGIFWTRNDTVGDALVYTLTASVFRRRSESRTTTESEELELVGGQPGRLLREQIEQALARDTRLGVNVNARLQWRLDGGGSLVVMPGVWHSQGDGTRQAQLTALGGLLAPPYASAEGTSESRFTSSRLNMQWRQTLGATGIRAEATGGVSEARSESSSLRHEFDAAGVRLRSTRDDSSWRDRTALVNGKFSKLLDGDHSLVAGIEHERVTRNETRLTTQDAVDPLASFDGDLAASSRRSALYVQDEWAVTPQWAAHAGLRWESIETRGDPGDGTHPANRSSVLTPLLHAVWKPDPNARDQIRVSLTRSYKAPTLANLVARPSLAARWPVDGPNTATAPDRAGNPGLQPELATGIDLAAERYLAQGGVLSANVFVRRIRDYIRSTTALEAVPWSPVERWVSRPQNVGRAWTAGLELEAKFRLDQAFDGAPPTELRANASVFRSRVSGVPGPDNRLDEQPPWVLNLGADHRFRGTPLTLGGSLNLTPAYRTQVADGQERQAGVRQVLDAYALWVFDPSSQLRLLLSNATASDYTTQSLLQAGGLRSSARTTAHTDLGWQLRWELKL